MIQQTQPLPETATAENLYSLIQGCIRQNRECQRILYTKYYGFSLKLVYRYVGDYSTAVWLTNESFLKVFRSFSRFKGKQHFSLESSLDRWIKEVLIQSVVAWSRSRDRDDATPANVSQVDADLCAPTATEDMAETQWCRMLMMWLVSLPLFHRLVFNLAVIDGYSTFEVTRLCGMRLKVVKRYLAEARLMLGDAASAH
jgi:RNA polymerase sigma factor (sigma-70 family)